MKFLELSTAISLRTTCWQPGLKCLWCPAFAQPGEARSSDCCKLSSLDFLSKKKKGLLSLSISTAVYERLSPTQARSPG